MDQSDGQSSKVRDVVVQQLGWLVHSIVVAAITNALDVSMVGASNELLQISQTVGSGISVDQLGLYKRFASLLTGHLKIADKILPASGAVRSRNNVQVG